MNFTTENSDYNTSNIVLRLDDDMCLDHVALEMIEHNKIPGLLDMVYTQNDMNRILKYNVTSHVSMSQLLERTINKATLIKCFIGIIDTVKNADEYMLEQNGFMIQTEHIYVRLGSYEIGLIYLPLQINEKTVRLENFFKEILFTAQFDPSENCEYVARIISYLNNQGFSLSEFEIFLHNIAGNKISKSPTVNIQKPSEPQVQPQSQQPSYQNNYYSPSQHAHQQVVSNAIAKPEEKKIPEKKETKTVVDAFKINQKTKVPDNRSAANGLNIPGQPAQKIQQQIPGQPIPAVKQQVGNGQQSISIPGQPAKGIQQEQSQKKETKKGGFFSAFGKKSDKKKQENSESLESVYVPGHNQHLQNSNASIQREKTEIPDRVQSNAYMNQTVSHPNQTGGGFGKTIVFNANNSSRETTVLRPNVVQQSQNDSQNKRCYAYLIRQKNGERILIDKEEFRIGKENSYVDYFIGDNTAISRSHAHIINREEHFYIMDTNSKNHTYIDGHMIPPNIEVEIFSGATIRLADEEFKFEQK